MQLTATNVRMIALDCLFKPQEVIGKEVPKDAVVVEGITRKFALHPQRLESHRAEIISMIEKLPDEFLKNKGGGWSFLNLCNDRDGHQWGEHVDMEAFCVLAIGLGLAEWLLPRHMWHTLPGSMPYIGFTLPEKAEQ